MQAGGVVTLPVQLAKRELRSALRARTGSLSPIDRVAINARIAERVWTVPELGAARTILLYAALPDEVATDAIAQEAWRRGIVVVYPRCLVESREIALHLVTDDSELLPGSFGIREPALHCAVTDPAEIDVALVPGLGFDREGGRIGRGAGYYDRLLADPRWRALKIGIFPALAEVSMIPREGWDISLDRIVTEKEEIRCRPGSPPP